MISFNSALKILEPTNYQLGLNSIWGYIYSCFSVIIVLITLRTELLTKFWLNPIVPH